jgi:hypothetical protein
MDWSGLDVILGLIKDFEIDVILVMGHDQLFASLQGALEAGPSGVKPVIINLPVSGGKVQRVRPILVMLSLGLSLFVVFFNRTFPLESDYGN